MTTGEKWESDGKIKCGKMRSLFLRAAGLALQVPPVPGNIYDAGIEGAFHPDRAEPHLDCTCDSRVVCVKRDTSHITIVSRNSNR